MPKPDLYDEMMQRLSVDRETVDMATVTAEEQEAIEYILAEANPLNSHVPPDAPAPPPLPEAPTPPDPVSD